MSMQKEPSLCSAIDGRSPGTKCGCSTDVVVVPLRWQLGHQSTRLPAAELSSSYSWTPHSSNFQLSSPIFLFLLLFLLLCTCLLRSCSFSSPKLISLYVFQRASMSSDLLRDMIPLSLSSSSLLDSRFYLSSSM